ncbi:MAG: methyltransferase domain-containing protein [Endomicrobiales bacterium]|nr:methyltransferase domain-containing protein [Endomicrobiales bacterium]
MGYKLKWSEYVLLAVIFAVIYSWILVDQFVLPEYMRPFAFFMIALVSLIFFFFIVKPEQQNSLAGFLSIVLGSVAGVTIILQHMIVKFDVSYKAFIILAGAVVTPFIAGGVYSVYKILLPYGGKVCPWWHAYTFDNKLRLLVQNPEKIVGPYIKQGDTVADIGCGLGFFSIAMANMVGQEGKVIAVDLQEKMLEGLYRRAVKSNVENRIEIHRCSQNSLDLSINQEVDFVLASYSVHEVPDKRKLFEEVSKILKTGGKFLVSEPLGHVSKKDLDEYVEFAREFNLKSLEAVKVFYSKTLLFEKN